MKKGTKLPVTYQGKVVRESEVLDRDNGAINITITDPTMSKLLGSSMIDGAAYRLIHGSLECIPRFKKTDKKEI